MPTSSILFSSYYSLFSLITTVSTIIIFSIILPSSSSFPGVSALSCSDIPTKSPSELFAFGPISSAGTATFDFHMSTTMTSPYGMVSGYSQKITSGSTLTFSQQFWWMGTLGNHQNIYAYLPGASTAFCTWPLRRLFKQVRSGILKQHLHETAMGTSFTPNTVASADTTFNFYLYGDDSESYAILIDNDGYKIDVMISEHRTCDTTDAGLTHKNLGDTASGTRLNNTCYRWQVNGGLPSGIYSVCLKITNGNSDTSGWFPLSAANGHYRHNMVVGSITTGPSTVFDAHNNPIFYSSNAFYLKSFIRNDGVWQKFAYDSSFDVCNPLAEQAFEFSSLARFNCTDSCCCLTFIDDSDLATITPKYPATSPGGGHAVLCGARKSTEPWMLLSSNSHVVNKCPYYLGYVWYNGVCTTCPTATECNNAGYCNQETPPDGVSATLSCTCYPAFFGDTCQYKDLDPPTPDLGNNSIVRSYTVVTFACEDSAHEVWFKYAINSSTSNLEEYNYIYLPTLASSSDPLTVEVETWCKSSNGSETTASRRTTYFYTVMKPTGTRSLSQNTSSLSESLSPSEDPSASVTISLISHTKTFTTTRNGPTPTIPVTPILMDIETCQAALNDSSPLVIQSPNATSSIFQITEAMRCGDCVSLSCSWGLAGSCLTTKSFVANLSYVSLYPTPYCNISFWDSVSASIISNISMNISIRPTRLLSGNLWMPPVGVTYNNSLLRTRGALSVALLNYSAVPPNVPFSKRNSSIQLRICNSSNTSWYTMKQVNLSSSTTFNVSEILTIIPLPAGIFSSVCLEILLSFPPMDTVTYFMTISVDGDGSEVNETESFVLGDIAPTLIKVSEGRYLPPLSVEEPSRIAVEVGSAFDESSNSKFSTQLSSLTEFNAATFAVIAGTLLVGGAVIYFVFQKYKPKTKDNVPRIVNAMISPADKVMK